MEKNKDTTHFDKLDLAALADLSEENDEDEVEIGKKKAMPPKPAWMGDFVLPETIEIIDSPPLCPGGDIPIDEVYKK